jgi:predicted transcriptional regulator
MAPAVVGNHIGMTVLNTGPLLSRILVRGLVEKPDKKPNRYQITQKGKEFLINPLRRLQRSNLHQNRRLNYRVNYRVKYRMNHRQEVNKKSPRRSRI